MYNDYELNGMKIQCVTQFKDLHVVIDFNLAFVLHIKYICNHVTKMLRFIIRNTSTFKNTQSLKVLYYAYIRSKLEYCSVIWDSHYNVHIMRVECIKRRHCKFLYMVNHGVYTEIHD